MKSIIEHIKTLPQEDWDYYSDLSEKDLDNPFINEITHKDFIRRYFIRSGKEDVIDQFSVKIEALKNASHTTSIFFLGVILYYNTNLKDKVFKGVNPPGYKVFPFLWFMTSLFHDYAYQYEFDQESQNKILDLESLKKELDIANFLLDIKITGTSKKLFSCCREYFRYRREVMNVVDHGILAGAYLYDRLIKIREAKEAGNNDSLFWEKALEKQYALSSASIATHNIWLPKKEREEQYKAYNLEYLINFTPIKIKDFPLLYILGIVDTIDPIKAFIDVKSEIDEKYILENLLVSFKPNSITFINSENSRLDFKKIICKAMNFYGWLDVEISFSKNLLSIKMK